MSNTNLRCFVRYQRVFLLSLSVHVLFFYGTFTSFLKMLLDANLNSLTGVFVGQRQNCQAKRIFLNEEVIISSSQT